MVSNEKIIDLITQQIIIIYIVMWNAAELFVVTAAIASFFTWGYKQLNVEATTVKASNGREYVVVETPSKSEAAEKLATITSRVEHFIAKLNVEFAEDPRVKLLTRRYKSDNVSEGTSKNGFTSYSVNKGERIVLCIRQRDGQFADDNDVFYVTVHELAHLATNDIGHTDNFWKTFKFLIDQAIRYQLYEYRNYDRNPVQYCGISISSTVATKI